MEINIGEYLSKGYEAAKNDQYIECEKYADKVLEVDPESAQAWLLKGISVGWQGSLTKIRLNESYEAWKKTFKYLADYDNIEAMASIMAAEYTNMVHSMFLGYMNFSVSHIGRGDAQESMQLIEKLNLSYLMQKIEFGVAYHQAVATEETKEEVMEKNPFYNTIDFPYHKWKSVMLDIKQKGDSALARDIALDASRLSTASKDSLLCAFMMQTLIPKILGIQFRAEAYDVADQINNGFESKVAALFSRSQAADIFSTIKEDSRKGRKTLKEDLIKEEQRKKEKEEKAKQKRVAAYWEKHPEEKKMLEDEKEELLGKVKTCNEKVAAIDRETLPERERLAKEKKAYTPSEAEVIKKEELERTLTIQRDKCGIFKGKLKKELTGQIGAIRLELYDLRKAATEERAAKERDYNEKVKYLLRESDEINATIKQYNSRISEINTELTKDREEA